MSETRPTDATTALIRSLSFELAAQILVNYASDEMAEAGVSSLLPLYRARTFAPLPVDVENVIGLIEKDIVKIPHHACSGCGAKFADTGDLLAITGPHDGCSQPSGTCPICSSEVHPKKPGK